MPTRFTAARGRVPAATTEPSPDAQPVRHVFAEPSGRRWRVLQLVAVLLLLVLTGAVLVQVWPTLTMLRAPLPGPDAEAVVDRLGPSPVVLGTGPLVRLVDVRAGAVTDPFTGARLPDLSAADTARLGTASTVLQRYGYGAGEREIVLTFDDGPDPTWTPKVLDVLSRHHVQATFLVTGRSAATSPELLRRIVREGHTLGNHSISHRNLSDVPQWRARLELSGNQHLLSALTGRYVGLVRPPYDGGTSGNLAEEGLAIARAQQLGYPTASYDFDTHDWRYGGGSGDSGPLTGALPAQIALPPLDGADVTVLMHDAGGNRAHTVEYLDKVLIPTARQAGYTFVTVQTANPALAGAYGPARRADAATDRSVRAVVEAWLVYPNRLISMLFVFAVFSVFATGVPQAVLALWRSRGRPRAPARGERDPGGALTVSLVIAAYNEETVIEATLRSLVASTYPIREFIVVDDGSSDRTGQIVAGLADTLDPRIRLISQANAKKPAALNNAFQQCDSEIVITVDADTHAGPDMIGNLVRHFEADPFGTLGAVAGVVRVGNRRTNLLTRWQALEYLNQIGVERAAYDLLGAITIVPGACAAWRREAVQRAGGFSGETLAEDCDLTLALHRMGWRVTQDDRARADTEAPEDVDSLLKQRVRWTFGTLQAIVKNRDLVFRPRYGWLGMAILPWSLLSLTMPLFTIPFLLVVTGMAFAAHGPAVLGGYYLAFTAVQAVTAAVAVRLLAEPLSLLLMVPIYRLVYDPLRTYLLYRTGYLALRGVPVGWNKLTRTGTLNRRPEAAPEGPARVPGRRRPPPGPGGGPAAGGGAGGPEAPVDRLAEGEPIR